MYDSFVFKFRIFRREIEMHPEGAEKVVLAACVLHNVLRRECGVTYMPKRLIDHEDENMENVRVAGQWRTENHLDQVLHTTARNATEHARGVRETLTTYFCSPAGNMAGQFVNAHSNRVITQA